MESDIRKTIILDYYGVPGSGKSTQSHNYAEKLRKEGKIVVEPSYELDHNKNAIYRKFDKLLVAVQYVFIHPMKSKKIATLVKTNGYVFSNEALHQFVNVCTKLSAVERFKSKVDFIIFDEGIAQAAISLAINGEKNSSDNAAFIVSMLPLGENIHFVKVSLDSDEALKRVSKRNSKDTRIETLQSFEEQKVLMNKYQEEVEKI